jgi:hypothetical protein
MVASENGDTYIVELLLKKGVNIDLQDMGGWTAYFNHIGIVRLTMQLLIVKINLKIQK